MARSLPLENLYYHRMRGQLSTTCSNYWSSPIWNSKLQSTTNSYGQCSQILHVDPIDWSHPPPSWAVQPELNVLHGVNAASYKSQDLLHQPGLEHVSTGLPDQRSTCAATLLDKIVPTWLTLVQLSILTIKEGRRKLYTKKTVPHDDVT